MYKRKVLRAALYQPPFSHDAGVEWAGTDLPALFAQATNLARPAFWRMLADILRFNRDTTAMQRADCVHAITLGEYLDHGDFSVSRGQPDDRRDLAAHGIVTEARTNDVIGSDNAFQRGCRPRTS